MDIQFVKPSIEIIREENPLKRIELCGRVCYKSEDRITEGSAQKFVEKLVKSGHTSVLEHARVVVPHWYIQEILEDTERKKVWNKGHLKCYGISNRTYAYKNYRTVNARDFIAVGGTIEELDMMQNANDYMTVRFTCDRGISHELVRHRQMSFSQESTRYVNYKNRPIQFIVPLPFAWSVAPEDSDDRIILEAYKYSCEMSAGAYEYMLSMGCKPQEARIVLPTGLKTELIMTGTHQQWDDVFALRDSEAAHPQVRYLMKLLKEKLEGA